MPYRILVIDDDLALLDIISEALRLLDFEVEVAADGKAGLQKVFDAKPDLVILDIMMPSLDGWQTCEQIRLMSDVPIIIISALGTDEDMTKGLSLGADAYVTKPVSLAELEARVLAVLRRSYKYAESDRSFGTILAHRGLRVDLDRHQVDYQGWVISLSPTEYDLLVCLLKHKEKTLPFDFLLAQVWGREHRKDVSTLRLYISYLRKRLKQYGISSDMIHSEWGFGYRFD